MFYVSVRRYSTTSGDRHMLAVCVKGQCVFCMPAYMQPGYMLPTLKEVAKMLKS